LLLSEVNIVTVKIIALTLELDGTAVALLSGSRQYMGWVDHTSVLGLRLDTKLGSQFRELSRLS
jgi:hypothetical protein